MVVSSGALLFSRRKRDAEGLQLTIDSWTVPNSVAFGRRDSVTWADGQRCLLQLKPDPFVPLAFKPPSAVIVDPAEIGM